MATLTIKWTRQAIADVDNIYEFIAANNARTARATVVAGTSYIVAYRRRGRTIELLGVVHAARRWPDRF